MVTSFFLGEVASCYGCTTKQPGYLQHTVGEVSGKLVHQTIAFGSPAFCNYSYDLILIVLLCLLAVLYWICFLQRCHCKWGVCKREIKRTCLMCILYGERFGVYQLQFVNVIEYSWIFEWLFNIAMMYLSLLDYYWCYDGVLESTHERFVSKVLADVGYADDRKVCIHKRRVCDVALEALSSFRTYVMIR